MLPGRESRYPRRRRSAWLWYRSYAFTPTTTMTSKQLEIRVCVAASSSMGEATATWLDWSSASSRGRLELCVNSTEASTTSTYFVVMVAAVLRVRGNRDAHERILVAAVRSLGYE